MGIRFNPFTGSFDYEGAGVGGGTPAGSSGDIQLNLSGSFGFVTGFRWVSGELQVPGDVRLDGGGSFTTTWQLITPTANRTISFPDATGTVALVGGSSGQILANVNGAVAGTTTTWNSTDGTRHALPSGYGSGAGGAATQPTNKSTAVTLNSCCGQITMNAANLAAGALVTFTLTNNRIAATDILNVNHASVGVLGNYEIQARCAPGSATISVRNVSGGDLAEAIVIAFELRKATTT